MIDFCLKKCIVYCRRGEMSEYFVNTEAPGFYNDGDGYVYIRCLNDPMRSMRIIQHNCVLNNKQVLKIYGFIRQHKKAVYPRVYRTGGPNTSQTKDEFLSLYVHNAETDKSEHVKLSNLPVVYNEKLSQALQKTGDEALQIATGKSHHVPLSPTELVMLANAGRPR